MSSAPPNRAQLIPPPAAALMAPAHPFDAVAYAVLWVCAHAPCCGPLCSQFSNQQAPRSAAWARHQLCRHRQCRARAGFCNGAAAAAADSSGENNLMREQEDDEGPAGRPPSTPPCLLCCFCRRVLAVYWLLTRAVNHIHALGIFHFLN